MNIKQAIEHLENLKFAFDRFEMIETRAEDVKAFDIAIATMESSLYTLNYLESLKVKTKCHCCPKSEKLTDLQGMYLCQDCLKIFYNYRKILESNKGKI